MNKLTPEEQARNDRNIARYSNQPAGWSRAKTDLVGLVLIVIGVVILVSVLR